MKTLSVTSPAFSEGEWIPRKYTGYGEDISPELHIENIAKDGVTMLIVLDDASHPLFKNFNHWIAWNIPVQKVIPEGVPAGACLESPIQIHQGLGYGRHRYRGPKPPFHWNHTYVFTIFILDSALDVPDKSKREVVYEAMEGHVLQRGTLSGKFQNRREGK